MTGSLPLKCFWRAGRAPHYALETRDSQRDSPRAFDGLKRRNEFRCASLQETGDVRAFAGQMFPSSARLNQRRKTLCCLRSRAGSGRQFGLEARAPAISDAQAFKAGTMLSTAASTGSALFRNRTFIDATALPLARIGTPTVDIR